MTHLCIHVASLIAKMKEEIFGPILPIINAESATEAVEMINARPKPLALYVFSEDKGVQDLFKNQTSSGGLLFNDTLCLVPSRPTSSGD